MQSRPFHTMTNFWEPYIICSLIFKKLYRISSCGISSFIIWYTWINPPSGIPTLTLTPPPTLSLPLPLALALTKIQYWDRAGGGRNIV